MDKSIYNREKIEFVKSYFKYRKTGIIVFLVFSFIFLTSFLLYRLPVLAVLYPAVICCIVGIGIFIFDLKKVFNKHKELMRIKTLSATLINSFPNTDEISEEDYIDIINMLCDEYRQLISEMDKKYWNMVDYYTIWAHQIKTPIASMKLNLQNEDTDFARRMSSELFRIEQYVDMVLMFLRLDSEDTDYLIKEYDLDSIVKQAIKKFSSEFIMRKIALNYEPVDTKVITDEKWLSFVVEQVISNSLKYTRQGFITISLEEPKTLCITDTGIGIASEDLPRIFDRGYTGYNGRLYKKASGIGLYLCRRICRNLGHNITAESKIGEGTTVRINLQQQKIEFE